MAGSAAQWRVPAAKAQRRGMVTASLRRRFIRFLSTVRSGLQNWHEGATLLPCFVDSLTVLGLGAEPGVNLKTARGLDATLSSSRLGSQETARDESGSCGETA